jgi:hypothetical protein
MSDLERKIITAISRAIGFCQGALIVWAVTSIIYHLTI